jgi:hypothetical protein
VSWNNDFARTANLRDMLNDTGFSCDDATVLRLLDMYEAAVRRRMSGVGPPKDRNWREELVGIYLRRYTLYGAEGRKDLAEQDLLRAAELACAPKKPTIDKIEFYRRVAARIYGLKPYR